MWNTLTTREVEYTKEALKVLENVKWAEPLLARIEEGGGFCKENMPLLFEARFAAELVHSGLTAEYEYSAGIGGSTIDFRIQGSRECLVELVSIGGSKAVEDATRSYGSLSICTLTSPSADKTDAENKKSQEGELLLVQQKIGEKVFKNNVPTKFPPITPNGAVHYILVDMRSYSFNEADYDDYAQIALGQHYVRHPANVAHWQSGAILGLFEKDNPLKAAPVLQERIHMIGFVSEKQYFAGEMRSLCRFMANQSLFADKEEAIEALFFNG